MYAIIHETSTDDGYVGRSPISEFVPLKSEDEVIKWITTYGTYSKYKVITYDECQVQKVVRILTPVKEIKKQKDICNCGRNMCPICHGF